MPKTCTTEGCSQPVLARGCCNKHYQQLPDRKAAVAALYQRTKHRKRPPSPESRAQTQRRYQSTHLEVGRRCENLRRARKSGAGGSYTLEEWEQIKASYGGLCAACRKSPHLHADHIVPICLGGPSWAWNLQPLCKSCNSRKGRKPELYLLSPDQKPLKYSVPLPTTSAPGMADWILEIRAALMSLRSSTRAGS